MIATLEPAPAVFIGWQSGNGVLPDFALFNLTRDVAGHPKDSTVSAATLVRLGFAVDEQFTKGKK